MPRIKAVPTQATVILFDKDFLTFVLILYGLLGSLAWVVAAIVFRDLGFTTWIGDIFGLWMVLGGGLCLAWAYFALGALLGKAALVIDGDGLTDRSSLFPMGRIAWKDVQSIQWRLGPQLPLVRYLAIDLRRHAKPTDRSRVRRYLRKALRSNGIDVRKLTTSREDLAYLFRLYSGGRFSIAQK